MGCTATQLFASFRSNPLNESFVSPGVSPGGVIVSQHYADSSSSKSSIFVLIKMRHPEASSQRCG